MSRSRYILIGCFAAILLALAALPWWLGAALRPVARLIGADFTRYERTGYARFRLEDVRWQRQGQVFEAGRIEADTPLVWLGRRLTGAKPAVRVEAWRFVRSSSPARDNPDASPVAGLPQARSMLRNRLPRILFWLPRAEAVDGTVAGLGPEIHVARIEWDERGLRAREIAAAGHAADATVTVTEDAAQLRAQSKEADATLELALRGPELAGILRWRNQTAELRAHFPASGWMPETASVTADDWNVPADALRMGGAYDAVHGSAKLEWHDGAWALTLAANAAPRRENAPPFDLRATAHGDRENITVDSLHFDAPFAQARLSAPITVALQGPSPEQQAQLRVEADLAQLPWIEAKGRASGTVDVTAVDRAARLAFALDFSEAAWRGFSLPAARARGTLQWPLLAIASLRAELSPGARLEAAGQWNLATRELAAVTVQATAAAADLAEWLPAGLSWQAATLDARMEGPLLSPRHSGRLAFTGLARAPLQPLDGNAAWEGAGTAVDELTAHLQTGGTNLQLSARLDATGADIRELRLESPGLTPWQLAAPARVSWKPAWRVENFRLAGAEGHLDLRGERGATVSFAVDAAQVASERLQAWMQLPGPAWRIDSLHAEGGEGKDGFAFSTKLAGEVELPSGAARLALTAAGNEQGLRLEELTAATGDRVLTRASGRLPLVWDSNPLPRLHLDANAPLEMTASIDPESPVWALLSAYAHVQLDRPTANLDINGTLARPTGRVEVAAAAIRPAGEASPMLPDVTDLRLAAELRRDALAITRLSARLDGQLLAGHAELPLDDERWTQLWREPSRLDWKAARGRLELANADLAVFARRLPQFVAPQGRLDADVALTPGGAFQGSLRVSGAATRPLPPFGVVQNIDADVQLDGQTLRVASLSGRLGGEPVRVTGTVTRTKNGAWHPVLALRGGNLPLVRSSGLLLRTDLDLRTAIGAEGTVQLEGVVQVRDCLVLANLAALLPSGARGVTRSPPYFSVEAAPFRDWKLAVDLRGPHAVRARTAVFEGTATPAFRLTGTLGEPRAVGQLTVDEGRVIFPFAVFTVQQGAVRLSEADPFTPRIDARATARRLGYDLVLEAGGTPAAPTLTFSSNPALDAADVLMMVTTGRPPESGTGGLDTPQRLARFGTFLGRGLIQEFGIGGGDRLEISTGEDVSRAGRETYRIEYRVNDRWFLVGEYDEYDQYNAGVRWRVHSVGGKGDE